MHPARLGTQSTAAGSLSDLRRTVCRGVTHRRVACRRSPRSRVDLWGWWPERRDQIPIRQVGQHPCIDPVGLGGERHQRLDPLSVSHLNSPAMGLQSVMNEPGTSHRLHHCPHRSSEPRCQDSRTEWSGALISDGTPSEGPEPPYATHPPLGCGGKNAYAAWPATTPDNAGL